MNLKPTLSASLLLLITSFGAFAQASWHALQNTGLSIDNSFRFEDVYFTSVDTGFTVTLRGVIYKTTDAGRSWTPKFGALGSGPGFRSIEFLADGQTGIAGTLDSPGHVFRTTDGGNTWSDIQSAVPDTLPGTAKMMCGLAHLGNTFYGVGSWGSKIARFYKSTDKGVTWQTHYMDTALVNNLIDISFVTADTGFVTGCKENNVLNQSVVLQTTDGGLTWKKVFSDSFTGGRIWKLQVLSRQLMVASIEPYYSDTVAMIKSTDGGANWTVLGTGYTAPSGSSFNSTQGIGFANAQQGWLGGYYNGMFETLDGGLTWNYLLFGRYLNRFFVLDATHIYAGGSKIYFWGNDNPNAVSSAGSAANHAPHHLYDISPNPARGTVKIEFDLYTNTYVVLNVVNVDGRKNWRIADGTMPKGHYTYEWSSADAPAGNYLVWMGTNEIPVVKKFTLLK